MRTKWWVLVAAGVLAATAGCAGLPADRASTQSRKLVTGPSTTIVEPPRELLIRDAEGSYPTDSYAGLTVAVAGFVVHRVPVAGVEEFDAGLRDRYPQFRLTFADARHPRLLLHEVAKRIGTDIAYWRAEGVVVAAVTPRADGSGVEVMVDRASAKLADTMRARYGFADLAFTAGEITPA
ncbi:hypothetical protein QQG74_06500 [Micromonospora sp. FIMYZ51]|uniref:hypothetical protein n=1 Tax=Micromonospora sp. FIMYZ51 TaxID=3051832 RepID=UPI00311F496A